MLKRLKEIFRRKEADILDVALSRSYLTGRSTVCYVEGDGVYKVTVEPYKAKPGECIMVNGELNRLMVPESTGQIRSD